MNEAMSELTIMSADEVTRAEYNARLKQLNDFRAGQTEKYRQGLEEGIATGAYNKALEMAKNLSSMGLSIEQISKATGLSVEEIQAMRI